MIAVSSYAMINNKVGMHGPMSMHIIATIIFTQNSRTFQDNFKILCRNHVNMIFYVNNLQVN